MKLLYQVKIVSIFTILGQVYASAPSFERLKYSLYSRDQDGNTSYAPTLTTCPAAKGDQGFIRDAKSQKVSKEEADYIERHQKATQKAWTTWLISATGPNLDGADGMAGGVAQYTATLKNLPKVGIAVSGGGYRAMIHGAGVLKGLDGREAVANERGTGGFLQLASYIAGTSGGSWSVGGLALNNWPTVGEMASKTWDLSQNLLTPTRGTFSFYSSMIQQVKSKENAGYQVGITDYWGRAISHHLMSSSTGESFGSATLFSDIRKTSNFISAAFPFPLVNAEEGEKGDPLTSKKTTMFEFTPFEFGSWDPSVAAFIPIEILGTNLTNGVSSHVGKQCVAGFENFGWVVGTSAAHFKALFATIGTKISALPAPLQKMLGYIASQPSDGSIVPNPFFGLASSPGVSKRRDILLVDGGEDGQGIPMDHLLQPSRALDMILAVDSSADVNNWPVGTALYETYLRISGHYNHIAMPVIPNANTFVSLGLNTRPTFFGCEAGKTKGRGPLIVYTANYPWSATTNTSSFQFAYESTQMQAMLENGVNVATMGGLTRGATHWPTCLACASLQRSFERSGKIRPKVCDTCMQAYCWDGRADAKQASTTYAPVLGPPRSLSTLGALNNSTTMGAVGNGTVTGAPGVVPGLQAGVSPKVTKGVYPGVTPGVAAAHGGTAPVAGVGNSNAHSVPAVIPKVVSPKVPTTAAQK